MEKKYLRMIGKMREKDESPQKDWTVYIVRCGDDTLYTGIAKDVDKRLGQHNSGRGAAYTRSRLPVRLIYRQAGLTRSEALVREARIKTLPKTAKEKLIGISY